MTQETCEIATRRVRSVTASRIRSSGATITFAPDAASGPDETEVLAVTRHDLVLGAELEAGQDDVAAVRRRAGQ